MGIYHGGRVVSEFGVGELMQIVPRFCDVVKFQAPDCLHYNAVVQQKAYQPHYCNTVFTIS